MRQLQTQQMAEKRRKFIAGDFKPASARSAKDGIQIRYYLNSADEKALHAERRYVRNKAKANLKQFKKKLASERKSAREYNKEDDELDADYEREGSSRSRGGKINENKEPSATDDNGLIFEDGNDEVIDGTTRR